MTKRGRILQDTDLGPGLLTVEGKQYSFVREDMWVSDVAPRTGMPVNVRFNAEGAPASVAAALDGSLARQQANRAMPPARQQDSVPAGSTRSRLGVLSLAAEALLLISFFLFPNLRVGTGLGQRTFNGWDAIGLDPATMAPTGHGLQNLLAIACLFAPLAAPFVRSAWSRRLYALPFAFTVLALLSVSTEIQSPGIPSRQALGDLAGSVAGAPLGNFAPGVGAYLVLLCSVYLLSRSFTRIPGASPGAAPGTAPGAAPGLPTSNAQ